jgi:spore maturation protein CgeB
MKIVIFGLSITSAWGNGHATSFRGLVRELAKRGHRVTFFEREAPWHAAHRDLPAPPYCRTILYSSLEQCFGYYGGELRCCSGGKGRFVVAGPQYPATLNWSPNIRRIGHDRMKPGYAPSARLFEAAACAVPIISDRWTGIEDFFVPGAEILIAGDSGEVQQYLRELSEEERSAIAVRARARVLSGHTAAHRAQELEGYLTQAGKK